MNASPPAHTVLTTVEEGNDDENRSKTPSTIGKQSLQLEEAAFRSKLKREATSNLIASLHSLKPVDVADTRLIDIAILNEDSTRTSVRLTVRNLLNEIGKVATSRWATAIQADPSLTLSPAVQAALRKWTHKSRKNSDLPAGEGVPQLQIRDLRQLDSHFDHQEEPYVLVRRHCVLISLGPQIRVIVQSKRLMILAHQDDDKDKEQIQTLLSLLCDTIHELMKSPKLGVEMSDVLIPFEVKAYSAVFSLYHSLLSKEYAAHLYNSKSMVNAIGNHTMLSVKLQEFMHTNHDNVVDLQTRLASATKMISNLLENETDLMFMNLKAAEKNHSLYGLSTEDAGNEVCSIFPDMEAVVESILVDFRTIEKKTDVMVRKLTHLEESINMKLSTSCNELLFASTIMSVFGTVIGFGGYVTGAFGMNLDNTETIQTTPGWFAGVCSSTLFLIIFGSCVIIAIFYHFHYLPTHAHMFKNADYVDKKRFLL